MGNTGNRGNAGKGNCGLGWNRSFGSRCSRSDGVETRYLNAVDADNGAFGTLLFGRGIEDVHALGSHFGERFGGFGGLFATALLR